LGLGDSIIYNLRTLEEIGLNLDRFPFSIRILLENILRNFDDNIITLEDVNTIANWPTGVNEASIPYMPARVLLQDLTGVPLIVDMAAIREVVATNGGDPAKINPINPVDLVIDHSVQVDYYGSPQACHLNLKKEYERNKERYYLIKWAQQSFENTRIVPTSSGICHQVNLEYLALTVIQRGFRGEITAFPDTCVGTDSHTPMINGVSVVGWGVGGIEAEAVMLGQPYYIPLPEVIGIKLTGSLPEGATATDLVLTITEMLRKRNLVGRFIEFFGPGLSNLTVPDRATISNMSPEMAITIGFFPIDDQTLKYLILSGRDEKHVNFVERYARHQKLFRTNETPDPEFNQVLTLDLSTIQPSIAGPINPEEQVTLKHAKERLNKYMKEHASTRNREEISTSVMIKDKKSTLNEGDIVIAAITSCTNTSNPSVMVGAGLLARKAVELGLSVNPLIKTSLAPGSKVVTDYLNELDLTRYLDILGFNLVGYGCTTCIGNSGPLKPELVKEINEKDLVVASVLSGNRNFEGRISPHVRANFLASPPLVVAFALAGTIAINMNKEPLGVDKSGIPVYLKDIWPSNEEIKQAVQKGISPEMYKKEYSVIAKGDANWQALEAPNITLFQWDPDSTYIRAPPFFDQFKPGKIKPSNIKGARVLLALDDKVSTDHISPAGSIPKDSPAGQYLISKGVNKSDFNTYGARRGNHEIMMRGTFANIRVRNQLAPNREGWWTVYHPESELTSVYEAAEKYMKNRTPTIILGSSLYGVGSSRDWAAKGPALLGVKAVIAKNFERIHRSNLIGMGILPLEFEKGEGWRELGLDGTETYDIEGLDNEIKIKKRLKVIARKKDSPTIEFFVTARLDAPIEIEYYLHGGILPYLVTDLLRQPLF